MSSGGNVMVAAGNKHTLILKDGNVYATGENSFGRLGLAGLRGKSEGGRSEGRIKFGSGLDVKIGFIAAGPDHSVAVSQDGETLYCWGCCDRVGVGLHDEKPRARYDRGLLAAAGDEEEDAGPQPFQPVPVRFTLEPPRMSQPRRVLQVSCGAQHTIALRDDGCVFTWGKGADGRLGHRGVNSVDTPKLLAAFQTSADQSVVQVCAGHSHSMALDRQGKVWTWGNRNWGKLGHPDLQRTESHQIVPRHVEGITRDDSLGNSKEGVVSIHCNADHSLAITNTQRLFVWGRNQYGKTGLGEHADDNYWAPQEVPGLQHVIRAVCGLNHTVAVTASGGVYAWGLATNFKCGVAPDKGQSCFRSPNKIAFFDADKGVYKDFVEGHNTFASRKFRPQAVAVGDAHSLALCEGSQLVSWGSNKFGQLGTGQLSNSDRPIPLLRFLDENVFVRQIACGANHSLALASNGLMFSWGDNSHGQLGLSIRDNARTPLPIKSLATTHVESIACGANTCAAIERSQAAEKRTGRTYTVNRIFTWSAAAHTSTRTRA